MHLLATSSALLDEQSAAVDIAQPVANVLVASFSDSDLQSLAAAHTAAGVGWSLGLVNLRVLAHPMSVDLWLDRTARHAKLIVVRVLGGLDWWRYGAESLAQRCQRHGIHLALLPGEDRDDPRLAERSTLPGPTLSRLLALFRAGGMANADGLVRGLSSLLDSGDDIPDAVAAPLVAPYAMAGNGAAGRVVVLLYRSQVLAGDTAPADMLIERLAAAGVAVHAFHLPGLKVPGVADALATHNIGPVDLVLTLTAFGGGGDLPFGDAPLLHLVNATTLRDAWAASDRGLGASDLAMHVVLPEIDGRVLTGAIAFKQADDATAVALSRPEPALLDRVVERVLARLRLRHTPAPDRRLVILLPDYPGAAGREAYAVGLDVPASLRAIINLLQGAGWQTGPLPATDRALLDGIIQGDAAAHLPLSAYQAWLDAHPDAANRMLEAWGPPQDDPVFQDGAFRFRALACGLHWLALPPERGRFDQRRADYHDVSLPPRHGLMAFCHWMQAQAPNALLHLGAHGTLEWLPGKAVALTPDCFPELAVAALPVIYPFILTNPGEAAQAKRRLTAITPGHLPPPLAEGSLTGPMAELERLVEEYAQADGVDPRRRDRLGSLILDEARAQGLLSTLGLESQEGGEALRKIDAWLCDLKDMALQDGLHIYGQAPAGAAPEIIASAAGERDGLLTALAGRHLPPGPAGAPARGRLDVLPSGRNLFTSDPRTLPTPTAFALARKAADAVIRLHLQEKGEMPRQLVLDLWGSAGLRTGGEEVAQVLAFLGCRPLWEPATGRVRGVEVLPPAVLDWPRVDVTCRLSGLFRDLFPAQIALLDSAIQAVAARDESDEDNPLAAASRAGDDLLRLFSCAPGRYGSGIDGALSDPSINAADLAGAYLEAAGFALKADGGMIPAPGAFARRVQGADLLVHGADDPHRDLLQGGADANFIGGFALAARADAGLIVLDTSNPDRPRPRPLAAALARIVRGRAAHPRHIQGLMRHGPRGGAEMAEAVDRLADFARATKGRGPDGASLVDGVLFDLLFDAYLGDPAVADFLARENPAAGRAIADRLDWLRRDGLWPCRRNDLSPLSRWLEGEAA